MGLSKPAVSQTVAESDIKSALSIHTSNHEHDSELARLERGAVELLEKACHRSFITKSFVLTLDEFPPEGVIYIPRPPLLSSNFSIQYVDSEGSTQTWDSSNYIVGTASDPGRVTPAYGVVWPTTRSQIEAVTIGFDAGYGTEPDDVPDGIKQAIILTVQAWFEETTPEGELPKGALSTVKAYHPGKFGSQYGVAS